MLQSQIEQLQGRFWTRTYSTDQIDQKDKQIKLTDRNKATAKGKFDRSPDNENETLLLETVPGKGYFLKKTC